MSLPALFAILLGVSLTVYAIFAGADFGAGILDLAARNGPKQRAALAHTIGPLWEANHVWVIFSITILFSAFPTAFAALGTVTLIPLTLAVMAIVIRGVSFGLRPDPAGHGRSDRLLGRAFGAASIAAPLLFGATAAALAEVSTPTRAATTPVSVPWTGLFAAVVGLLAVALCAYLAASFVTSRLGDGRDPALAERFRARALQSGAAVVALGAFSLLTAAWKAPALWHRLSTAAVPLLAIGVLAILTSLYAFAHRHYVLARVGAMLTAAAVLWGWLIAQSPRLVGTRLSIHSAAATPAALTGFAIALGAVLLAVIPAFFLLYTLFRRPIPEVTQ
jgi:cytochrome d ubiquinol oxidase subunit II